MNLIFDKYIALNQSNYCKFKTVYNKNYNDNMIKAEKNNAKAKIKQFKNKKQQQKYLKKKRKFANQQSIRFEVR